MSNANPDIEAIGPCGVRTRTGAFGFALLTPTYGLIRFLGDIDALSDANAASAPESGLHMPDDAFPGSTAHRSG